MKKQDFLKNIYDLLKNPDQESLKLSMNDVHHKGLFSLVIDGNEFGKLTRVFIADKKIPPYKIQLHSHRYPIRLTTIKGNIKHFVAFRSGVENCGTVKLSEFDYKSPINGGNGLKYLKETNVIINDYSVPIGATIKMDSEEFHTVSCSKGAIWIVEELGFQQESSKVLGVPFTIDGLYNEPKSFQINDKHQLVKKQVAKMLLDYEIV